jgi:hypothetical protein
MNKDRAPASFLQEEHSLRVYENRVTRRMFGPRRVVVKGSGGKCIMRSFTICILRQTLLGWSNRGGCDGRNIER